MSGIQRGLTNAEIGRELGIRPRTVHFHRTQIRRRLGVQNARELFLAVAALLGDLANGRDP